MESLMFIRNPGYTSHDVVAKLRGILNRKNRPYGNPWSQCCRSVAGLSWKSNEALQFYCLKRTKLIQLQCCLETETDTQDTTGQITNQTPEGEVMKLSEEKVFDVIKSYIGEYDQIPPMFSAIKNKWSEII